MRKVLLKVFVLVFVAGFISCAAHKPTVRTIEPAKPAVTSIVPQNLMEWDVTLSSPVSPMKQEIQETFIPAQVYNLFPTGLDFTGWQWVQATAKKNVLPGNALHWGIRGDMIYWPLTNKPDNWVETRQTNPMDFVYVIKPKEGHIAFWFTSPTTVHMKKIQLATKDDRPKDVYLPAFEKPVKFSWSFSWIRPTCEEDILKSVKGTVVEYSMQNGFVSVTTEWSGGESFTLPAAQTIISVGNETVYAD